MSGPDPWRVRVDELVHDHGLDGAAAPRLATLLELLRDDPTAPTSVTDPAEGVERHLADSLTGLDLAEVRAASTIADLGSGAGLPGLVLAVARPTATVALVESSAPKAKFLRRAVEAMAATNATVVHRRVEEWEYGLELQDLCTARALAPLTVLVEYAAPLLTIGGALVAWKGRRDREEERLGREAASRLHCEPVTVEELKPSAGADHRSLHVYVKVGPTPPGFPRPAGRARKRPLGG